MYSHFFAKQGFTLVVLDRIFFIWRSKKVVAGDRWTFYTVAIVWDMAWADSTLVGLHEWSIIEVVV